MQCVQYRGSEKGVTSNVNLSSNNNTPSFVVGQDNKNPVPIVDLGIKSRTSGTNNGGVMNQFGVNNVNKGHFNDAPHNSQNQLVSLGHNSCPEKVSSGDSHDNGIECQKNALKTNVFNARRFIDIPDKMVDNVLLYDVNIDSGDNDFELSNAMLLKDGWKKHGSYLEKNCSDFSRWKSQTDYTFGFVPLSNMIIPSNPDHIGVKVDDPIAQHLQIKPTGIPNFLGERIPIKSQLNVFEWKKLFADYWDQQLLHLVEFGFPLDFNRNSVLRHDYKNHSSAVDFLSDVQAYLDEEIKQWSNHGPIQCKPHSKFSCFTLYDQGKAKCTQPSCHY